MNRTVPGRVERTLLIVDDSLEDQELYQRYLLEPEPKHPDTVLGSDPDLAGIRALIVDDAPDTRDLLTVILANYGAEATPFCDGCDRYLLKKVGKFRRSP